MIRNPEEFFGRKAELDQIFGLLTKMTSVSVVGEQRIGKSSLLYHVFQTGLARVPEGVQLLYLDVHRVNTEQEFYTLLLEKLGARGNTYSDLVKTVSGRKIVVCVDEFEKVAGNAAFTVGFFDGLRSLAQESFTLATATQYSLADLCRDKQFAGSKFWNIFQPVDLGLLSQAEAEEYIRARFEAVGIQVSQEDIDRLLLLAGRWPFFLELACYRLFEMKAGRSEEWEMTFRQDANSHLRSLWDARTPDERKALQWVLNVGQRLPDDRICRSLERRGVLVKYSQETSGYWVFSEAFQDIVRVPPRPSRSQAWWRRLLPWIKGGEVEVSKEGPKVKIQAERPQDKH